MIYYEFLKLKIISGINKKFSEKEKHTSRHVAAPGSATCPADVSTGSATADVIITSVLTWSMLIKSTVNWSTARSAVRGQWGPSVSLTGETDMWIPRAGLKGKKKRCTVLVGSKGN